MKVTIEIGGDSNEGRTAHVRISKDELDSALLHIAQPEMRNRSECYMRRHPVPGEPPVAPNKPFRCPTAPPKLPIPEHISLMRREGILCPPKRSRDGDSGEEFLLEPAMIAFPISDIVANLLRPAFHRDRLGSTRLFCFADEPIHDRAYHCLCFFQGSAGNFIDIRPVKFDPDRDEATDSLGKDLLPQGLVWAAAVVPLVVDGRALTPVEITLWDYDLRQIVGRESEKAITQAYSGWPGHWPDHVQRLIRSHKSSGRPFETFYHSIIALDRAGDIHIIQRDGNLPGLAEELADSGYISAGLLDSGGSCALYDPWSGSYLNQSWYYREPRGAIIVLQTKAHQRIPVRGGSWASRREDLNSSEVM
jgi:hypothetical protein